MAHRASRLDRHRPGHASPSRPLSSSVRRGGLARRPGPSLLAWAGPAVIAWAIACYVLAGCTVGV